MDVVKLLTKLMNMDDGKLTQNELAAALGNGITQPQISRWLKGQDPERHNFNIITTYAEKVGAIPRARAGVMLVDESVFDQSIISAPLISWVSAGALKKPDDAINDLVDAKRVTAAGLDTAGQWIALRVVGDSMDRISPPESIVFVNLKDRRLVANACYVIADEDGGASYKRYRPDPARWEAVSMNKKHKPYKVTGDRGPRVIGRVKRTILDL